MKKLILMTVLLMSSNVFAQNKVSNNTLDINYMATYKSEFTLRMSSRLSENDGWALKGFNGGGAYNIGRGNSRFSLTYDLWRGNEYNAPIGRRFGLAFSTQSRFSNLNLSLYQTDAPNAPSGIAGRLDITMKFGN